MAVFCVVSSLQNHCLRAVACQLPNHETSLYALPVEIKAKLIHLLSKRGLLTDSNIEKVRLTSWYFTKLKPAQFVEALRPKSIILSFVKLTAQIAQKIIANAVRISWTCLPLLAKKKKRFFRPQTNSPTHAQKMTTILWFYDLNWSQNPN